MRPTFAAMRRTAVGSLAALAVLAAGCAEPRVGGASPYPNPRPVLSASDPKFLDIGEAAIENMSETSDQEPVLVGPVNIDSAGIRLLDVELTPDHDVETLFLTYPGDMDDHFILRDYTVDRSSDTTGVLRLDVGMVHEPYYGFKAWLY